MVVKISRVRHAVWRSPSIGRSAPEIILALLEARKTASAATSRASTGPLIDCAWNAASATVSID
jgi:hypothetical protein